MNTKSLPSVLTLVSPAPPPCRPTVILPSDSTQGARNSQPAMEVPVSLLSSPAVTYFGPEDDYIISDSTLGFVVSGAGRTSAGAFANEGFSKFNAYTSYCRESQTMFIHLRGAPEAGVYEITINYDRSGCRPSFWVPERVALLPPDTQAECNAYYPPKN